MKALEMFNFGAPLMQWINTFYSNIQNYATWCKAKLSCCSILVVIADYILANLIKNDQLITGIHFQGR